MDPGFSAQTAHLQALRHLGGKPGVHAFNLGTGNPVSVKEILDAVGRVTASLRSFTRYAPEEIVREVAVSGREAMLSGDKRDVSVLFCDLRGFTSFAEHMSAEELVTILNDHFELLVTLIAKHRGFVVDFLGDAVFAVFGAPQADPRHAEQAVACAIEMQRARTARNEETRGRGWPPLEMGIGISTGPVVVGNMGALRRIKYGVVGSTVNVAARIETFTVGGQALVADSTRQSLGHQLVVDEAPHEVLQHPVLFAELEIHGHSFPTILCSISAAISPSP